MITPTSQSIPGLLPNPPVRYALTRRDIFRFHVHSLVRNRILIAFMFIFSTWLAFSSLSQPEMATYSLGSRIFFILFFNFIFISIGFIGGLIPVVLMLFFRKYRGLLGQHELEIRDDGLVERTDVNESLHRWAGFHKVVTTRRFLYIYVTDSNFHIVPKNSFASELDALLFQNEIEKRMKEAGAGNQKR